MIPYRKSLFPVSIFHTNIRENNSLKERYLPRILDNYGKRSIDIPSGWDTGNVYTSFDNDGINQSIFDEVIVRTYFEYIKKFFDKEVEFDIVDLWFNCYENGEYQEQHNHLNYDIFNSTVAHFACIHYLRFDPKVHQSAVFVDPINELRFNTLEMTSNHYVSKYVPQVNEGDIIMFPNYLEHFVKQTPPTEGNPRVTISFNISVKKYGDMERD